MSGNRLKVEDVKVFSDAALGFFAQTTGHKASVRTAYLLDGAGPIVCAPRGLLSHVLLLLGESDYSDASHRDIVGEIANQMSGQARRHFGEALDISPPRVLSPEEGAASHPAGAVPFVIPMQWERYEAHLVVQMDKEGGTPP